MRYTSMALLVAAGLVAGCDKIDALTPPDLPAAPTIKQSVWLNQNWKPDDRFWFHHASQGTSTFPVPYSWFVALEQPTSGYLVGGCRRHLSGRTPPVRELGRFRIGR